VQIYEIILTPQINYLNDLLHYITKNNDIRKLKKSSFF